MELEGDMLDAMTFQKTEDGIDFGFFGKEAAKADGHLHFSAQSKNATAPKRRFLPAPGQEFVSEIKKGIEQIVSDALVDGVEFESSDFADVTTKAELYSALGDYFDGLSRAEIRMAITRAPMLAKFLDDEGLLDLL
jgi:hypothetical protein